MVLVLAGRAAAAFFRVAGGVSPPVQLGADQRPYGLDLFWPAKPTQRCTTRESRSTSTVNGSARSHGWATWFGGCSVPGESRLAAIPRKTADGSRRYRILAIRMAFAPPAANTVPVTVTFCSACGFNCWLEPSPGILALTGTYNFPSSPRMANGMPLSAHT